jgi:hypothetical protein
VDWRTVTAPATNKQEIALDQLQQKIRYLVSQGGESLQQAVDELAMLCRQHPDQYDAYCARTKTHRLAQRQFILDNPGCIQDKETRIRVLSALRSGVPRVETAALQWGLLQDTVAATQSAAAAAEEKKGKGRGKPKKETTSRIEGLAAGDDEVVVTPLIQEGRGAQELARERAKGKPGLAEGFE